MTLPKHAIDKSGDGALYTFAQTLTPAEQRDVHRQLGKAHPGASIATIGDRQVSVTDQANPCTLVELAMRGLPRRCVQCKTLIAKGSRCPACTPEKANTTSRGYGSAWAKLSKAVVRGDGHVCVYCGRRATADHVVPKARGGTDDMSTSSPPAERATGGRARGFLIRRADDPSASPTLCYRSARLTLACRALRGSPPRLAPALLRSDPPEAPRRCSRRPATNPPDHTWPCYQDGPSTLRVRHFGPRCGNAPDRRRT